MKRGVFFPTGPPCSSQPPSIMTPEMLLAYWLFGSGRKKILPTSFLSVGLAIQVKPMPSMMKVFWFPIAGLILSLFQWDFSNPKTIQFLISRFETLGGT